MVEKIQRKSSIVPQTDTQANIEGMQFRLETYVENTTGLTDIQGVHFVVKVVRILLAFSVYPLEAGYYRSSIIVPQPDTQEKIFIRA